MPDRSQALVSGTAPFGRVGATLRVDCRPCRCRRSRSPTSCGRSTRRDDASRRTEVVERLRASGQERAARIVSRLPVTEGDVLDMRHVDALGIRVHAELQRLAEELLLWRRVRATLAPLLVDLRHRASVAAASGESVPRPLRIVDVGCGLGYVVRALAARGDLGADVELVGVDLNPVLVGEARRLAQVEGLAARFVVGDALDPGVAVDDGAITLVISTGLLHHLPADALPG